MKGLKYILTALLVNTILTGYSQDIAIGEWRDNLPYEQTIDLVEVEDRIYCATPYSLFLYNKQDGHLKRLSKINGLSDVGISAIEYNESLKMLVVLYDNSNIDLITEKELVNIPDIKIAQITGTKVLNNIAFHEDLAYIGTGFGIVALDLKKKEVKETYFIGQNSTQVNVNDIAVGNDSIYAATDIGLYKASLNAPNLLNFEYWNVDTLLTSDAGFDYIEFFNNKFYVNKKCDQSNCDSLFRKNSDGWEYINLSGHKGSINNLKVSNNKLCIAKWGYMGIVNSNHELEYSKWLDEIRPNSIIVGEDDSVWIAEATKGLVQFTNDSEYVSLFPNGPNSIESFTGSSLGNTVIICEGGYNQDWSQKYNKGVYSIFVNGTWSYNQFFDEYKIWDITSAAIDPFDENHFFLASYYNGLIEMNGSEVTKFYSEPEYPFSHVTYVCYDKNGDLWFADWERIYKMDRNKNVSEIKFNDIISGWQVPDKIIFDNNNNPWVLVKRRNVIFANDGSSNYKLSFPSDNGNMKTFAIDLDGEIWIGSDKGISVVYSPDNIFNGGASVDRIIIEQDGYAQYLLETESVTDIEVDGANRKWVGTSNSGVFLISEDGQEQILHFTKSNSPLPSDNITDVVINNETGEVFFGTDLGTVSYKSDATRGGIEHASDAYAYPNPVKSSYSGPIAIKGLVKDAHVTITDVAGNLVYRTRALGGQAIWNGKNLNGEDASTGVYIVFSTDEDGEEKIATKILFVN